MRKSCVASISNEGGENRRQFLIYSESGLTTDIRSPAEDILSSIILLLQEFAGDCREHQLLSQGFGNPTKVCSRLVEAVSLRQHKFETGIKACLGREALRSDRGDVGVLVSVLVV